jgi:hypothetical protein
MRDRVAKEEEKEERRKMAKLDEPHRRQGVGCVART